MDRMFSEEGYEKTYEWVLRLIKEYLNCNMLIWQTAVMLDARRITDKCKKKEKYDKQINAWYELALHDENEEIRHHAADSLFGFYLRRDWHCGKMISVMRDFCQGRYRQLHIHWKWENIMSIRQCLILYVQGKM